MLYTIGFLVPSKVYFVRSYERSKAAAETRDKYKHLLIGGVLGSVIGYSVPKLIDKIVTHVWK